MSRAASLLAELRRQGAAVRIREGRLQLKAASPIPPALIAAIRAEKTAIVRVLTESVEGIESDLLDVPFPDEYPAPDPSFSDDGAQEDPENRTLGNLTAEERAALDFILCWNSDVERRASDRAARRQEPRS